MMQQGGGDQSLDHALSKLKDTDIPKLEFTKGSKSAVYEDWVQRATLRISGLHPEVEFYWIRVQSTSLAAYEQYLIADPMRRPVIRPDSTWMAAPTSFYKIEAKMRPIFLDIVPATVRFSALSTRQTGVVDVLFSVMIESGPGTLKDRESTLKAVSGSSKNVEVKDIFESLQNWNFHLTRCLRLGMTPPDPTIQANTLRAMVKSLAETDAGFAYRYQHF